MRFKINMAAGSSNPTTPSARSSGKRMRLSALAAAVVLSSAFAANYAYALSLGKLTVQSALGEPLSAEIEIPDISDAESASLRVGLAPADVYRAAGVDFNAVMADTEVRLERKTDGRLVLKVSSRRSITEPYLDLILEANWGAGRIVRDYTMLFDPPKAKTQAATTLPPPVSAAVTAPSQPMATPLPAAAPAPAPTSAMAVRTAPPPASARPLPPAPAASTKQIPDGNGGKQVTVKSGDTAGKIANANKPANTSLEQMLVAMLRTNPHAFIQDNIHKIKSGAVLNLPTPAEVSAVNAKEAIQIMATQSRDFNAFRQRLAATALPAADAAPGRNATGKVQAEVKDSQATAPSPDQLKLSKGSLNSAKKEAAAEEKIAKERQAKEAASRTAELSKNIADLTKLSTAASSPGAVPASASVAAAKAPVAAAASTAASTPAKTADPAPAASTAPAQPASAPAAAVAAAPTTPVAIASQAKPDDQPAASQVTSAASTASATPAPVAPVAAPEPAPAPATPAPPPVAPVIAAPPPPAEEPSFLDELLDNPLVLPVAGGLLVALLGLGIYRLRQRKKPQTVDSSFLESRLQPDSFFGVSGGQSVDTAEVLPTGSSMMYSPSQLDAGGDVDPVAEADVYLAYGRDLQAEEILKEALKVNPTRQAVHAKMLEIYAKRRDVKSFEMQAAELYALTQGNGPEWAQTCELGMDLSPGNPMFQPGEGTAFPSKTSGGVIAAAASIATASSVVDALPGMNSGIENAASDDNSVDLDLDFSIDAPLAPAEQSPTVAPVSPPAASTTAPDLDFGLDFDQFPPPAPAPVQPPASPQKSSQAEPDDLGLAFDFGDLTPPAPSPSAIPAPTAELSHDFDLHFDLPEPEPEQPKAAPEPVPSQATPPSADNNMLSFDMDDLSFDLDEPEVTPSKLDAIPDGDPLETKLSLAAEFLAIGDDEGARSLAEEVLEQATGALRNKAKAFLSNLN